MPNITQDQSLQIAQAFAGFANTVQNYRFAHFNALTDLQEASLRNVEATLRATSDNFLDMGINLALDNVQDALDGLSKVTDMINKDLTTLADINKAIQFVGVLVQLGTAFATANPTGIVSALGSAVSALTPDPPAAAAAPAAS